MWKWFLSFFIRTSEDKKLPEDVGDASDIYSLKERCIYRYCKGDFDADGKPIITYADPLVLWKKLMEKGPELIARMKVAFSESKGNIKSHSELVKQIQEAFEVKPYEEGGLTQPETIDLLNHFMVYMGRLKKNSSDYPTGPEEGTSGTSVSPSPDSPPTPNTSDSASTTNEPSTEVPPLSPSEQASPSEQSSPESTTSGQ